MKTLFKAKITEKLKKRCAVTRNILKQYLIFLLFILKYIVNGIYFKFGIYLNLTNK